MTIQQIHDIGPTWPEGGEKEIREDLEAGLAGYDAIMLVAVMRNADGGVDIKSHMLRRGRRVSAVEAIGALYCKLHDWMGQL